MSFSSIDLLQKGEEGEKTKRKTMSYKQVKSLKSSEFKRLCGVRPETFEQMLAVLRKNEEEKKPGRPSKLKLEDQILMTLQYLHEYRTYFHIAQSWGINESTAYRIVRKVEDSLIRAGVFSLPGKKQLLESQHQIEAIVIDVSESSIERPKKSECVISRLPRKARRTQDNKNAFTVAKRNGRH
jgi:Helix-turn-helix of DDE superfamily endonuclease